MINIIKGNISHLDFDEIGIHFLVKVEGETTSAFIDWETAKKLSLICKLWEGLEND